MREKPKNVRECDEPFVEGSLNGRERRGVKVAGAAVARVGAVVVGGPPTKKRRVQWISCFVWYGVVRLQSMESPPVDALGFRRACACAAVPANPLRRMGRGY